MNKTLIALALIALILYYYQKQKTEKSPPELICDSETREKELQAKLDQAIEIQTANETKLREAQNKIRELERAKNPEGVTSEYNPDLIQKQLETERDELKRKNQNLTLDKEKLTEEVEDLEAERDEVMRDKKTLEQEVLALNNQLRHKQQEVVNNQQELARVKKEFTEKDQALNKKLKE
jgi:chromosome segregation ATPase